ncbi:MAG: hypothetical protein ACLFSN_04030 [Candidatus Woesearchaeota archaeon]
MAKELGVCQLCKQKRLLNYAGLCKRCNKTQQGVKFATQAINRHHEELEAEAEQAHHMDEALQELHALEAKEDLTSDEKERLEELKVETQQAREKEEDEEDEKQEEKPEEKKDSEAAS